MEQPKFKKSLNIPNIENCIRLVNTIESFISKIEEVDNNKIITFSYRHPTYDDFNREYARNLRSITFDLESKECLVLSFHKFFNYNENPFTLPEYVSKWTPIKVNDKIDGSLILFYIINNKLYCKTKFNAFSDQSILAMDIVNSNPELKEKIYNIVMSGYTPMFELVHPDDPHVILYQNRHLYYLMSRNRKTGEYHYHNELGKFETPDEYQLTLNDIINDITKADIKDKEGFVIYFSNKEMVKFKYIQYVANHNIISNTCYTYEKVAEMYFNETIDDVLGIVTPALKEEIEKKLRIIKIEYLKFINEIKDIYNRIISSAKTELTRKDFALTAEKFDRKYFPHLMNMFISKGVCEFNKINQQFIKNKLWNMEDDISDE